MMAPMTVWRWWILVAAHQVLAYLLTYTGCVGGMLLLGVAGTFLWNPYTPVIREPAGADWFAILLVPLIAGFVIGRIFARHGFGGIWLVALLPAVLFAHQFAAWQLSGSTKYAWDLLLARQEHGDEGVYALFFTIPAAGCLAYAAAAQLGWLTWQFKPRTNSPEQQSESRS
jgi:hypothetical protein